MTSAPEALGSGPSAGQGAQASRPAVCTGPFRRVPIGFLSVHRPFPGAEALWTRPTPHRSSIGISVLVAHLSTGQSSWLVPSGAGRLSAPRRRSSNRPFGQVPSDEGPSGLFAGVGAEALRPAGRSSDPRRTGRPFQLGHEGPSGSVGRTTGRRRASAVGLEDRRRCRSTVVELRALQQRRRGVPWLGSADASGGSPVRQFVPWRVPSVAPRSLCLTARASGCSFGRVPWDGVRLASAPAAERSSLAGSASCRTGCTLEGARATSRRRACPGTSGVRRPHPFQFRVFRTRRAVHPAIASSALPQHADVEVRGEGLSFFLHRAGPRSRPGRPMRERRLP
jgi:hypothetical protein